MKEEGRKRDRKGERKKGAPKWKRVQAEIQQLAKRIPEETPPSGVLYYKYQAALAKDEAGQKEETKQITNRKTLETSDKSKIKIRFSDLPISKSSISGLMKAKFIKMTEVQRSAIPHAIGSRDLVVCSRTGSGKTLAYLIPAVELLYRQQWSNLDGLGVLILVPTRELGIQVFEVLRSFGGFHDLSAGLAIGGKDLSYEKKHIQGMNILVSTPGRLLQHMNDTETFDTSNLQMLVVDEVDRILDMGFKESLTQIMKNLRENHQTLLFSATVGRNLKDLTRVNLKKEHEYISIHDFESVESLANDYQDKEDREISEKLKSITPLTLVHYYMVVNIEDKLDLLFSFLKSHLKQKVLVFFSSCKQVRFAFESFKRLKLGISLLELHGRQKQSKRTAIYYNFLERKNTVLFATDIASRGIDFPAVDWVIQYDCPEDVYSYIHRVGRTARYKSKGNSLLFLLPSEQSMLGLVEKRGIQLRKQQANPNKSLTITSSLQKINAEDRDMQHLAQKSCISYLKSVHLMNNKDIFKLEEIAADKLAESLGLAQTPQLSFVPTTKNIERDLGEKSTDKPKVSKLAKLKMKIKNKEEQKKALTVPEKQENEKENISASQEDANGSQEDVSDSVDESEDSGEESEEFLVPKTGEQRKFSEEDDEGFVGQRLVASKTGLRKIKKDGPYQGKNKVYLDGEGKPISAMKHQMMQLQGMEGESKEEEIDFFMKVKKRLQENEVEDDKVAKGRLKEKRLKKKRKTREDFDEEQVAVLAGNNEQDELSNQSSEEMEIVKENLSKMKRKKLDSFDAGSQQRSRSNTKGESNEEKALALLGKMEELDF